jgi:DNA-binding CsgD family transcriptional regulator
LRELVDRLADEAQLTAREADVVFETLRGRGIKEVAFAMGCSEASIYTYWSRILLKAKQPSRERFLAHAVAVALSMRLR